MSLIEEKPQIVKEHSGMELVESFDRKLVHKYNEENVLLSGLDKLKSDGEHEKYLITVRVKMDHSFFFEHPRNHVPGMYIIEAGRQAGLAIAHKFYSVSFESEFILNQLTAEFFSFANIWQPLQILIEAKDVTWRKGQLVSYNLKGTFLQNSKEIAAICGILTVMGKNIMEKLERSFSKLEPESKA
ncbi:hypothetical protein EHO61_15075 [Leptospira fluminis]|uniref:A-factor biosynthesis hotdog domain-containing protein n=1 Tax=Leptospira fluminis TaxID=2484979 RepID=A0A4R9GN70_9LEPT|nr:AfsA-related hotdog domain-containing protein [Leptospira fluminis]TGK15672.1 hypothetical protein EHO61_15075 [Leptospira fluminis]